MLSRFITTFVLISVAAPAGAQTVVESQTSPVELSQVQAFENSLRAAIAKAGGQLAVRARQVAPNILLQFEAEARILGVVLPEGEGVQFFVDVPGIRHDTVLQWDLARLLNSRGQATQPAPVQSVTNGGAPAVRSTDVVPLKDPVLMTNPVAEYSTFTHDALVETILDAGVNLPVKSGQTLTLIVGDGTSGLPTNPLAAPQRFLYLRINGDDLLAFRQNTITRDEARKRIRQWVF